MSDRIPQPFREKSISVISSHDANCCNTARAWFESIDAAYCRKSDSRYPEWVQKEFSWKPSNWPIYWCEATQMDGFDCGVFAAIVRHLLTTKGHCVIPVQLIENFNEQNVINWESQWRQAKANTNWICDSKSYHEAVGVISDEDELNVWDPIDQGEITPPNSEGYGQVTHIRPIEPKHWTGPQNIIWEGQSLNLNKWQEATQQPVKESTDQQKQIVDVHSRR